MRYILPDKNTEPKFKYAILTGSTYVDHYLFAEDELEEAMAQLKKEAIAGFRTARIVIPHFCPDRTWRFMTFMNLDINHKILYDECPHTLLHVQFYLDSGTWLNPKEEWSND